MACIFDDNKQKKRDGKGNAEGETHASGRKNREERKNVHLSKVSLYLRAREPEPERPQNSKTLPSPIQTTTCFSPSFR